MKPTEELSEFQGLLLDDELAPASASLVLPGLRMFRESRMGAYQKAKAVHALRKGGLSSQDAAQSLGLSTRAATVHTAAILRLSR